MPTNYKAMIRYSIIDECLRDRSRIWNWEDLAHMIAQRLKEHGKEYRLPSKRTIMGDIAAMRSGILGYEAPIIYSRSEGYSYSNSGFSIFNLSVPSQLLSDMAESVELMLQLTRNQKLVKISQSLEKICDYLNINIEARGRQVIFFEPSLNEAGQSWLDTVYQYTLARQVMGVSYRAFKGETSYHMLSPSFIKEYNNRWYVFGWDHEMKQIINLALDRINSVQNSLREYWIPEDFDHDKWFKHLYGVTTPQGAQPVEIIFRTSLELSPYMDTKPIHHNQQKLSTDENGSVYKLLLYDNYEIRSKLRSFGKELEVISPEEMRQDN